MIGCIDGTHIPIKAPSINEGDYVNRKSVHSINVQVAIFWLLNIGVTNRPNKLIVLHR